MKSVDVISHLSAMRNLLADEKRWTKSVSARNADGDIELPTSPSAVCWCVVGASIRAHDDLRNASQVADDALSLLDHVVMAPNGHGVVAFNDAEETTHADVLAVICRASALVKEEAAND